MNRNLVAVVVTVLLGLGGLALAQTGTGDTVQPGTPGNPSYTDPAAQPAAQPAGDSQATAAPAAQAEPSAAAEPAPHPAAATADTKALPATAGSNPLMITIGVLALLAFATLLVRATRRVSRS